MTYTLSILDQTSLPVSQLLSAEQLCAADLFAVERNDGVSFAATASERDAAKSVLDSVLLGINVLDIPTSVYDQMLAVVGSYVHTNFKLRYDELSARLLDDIQNSLGLCSMAYRDSQEFARITHIHEGKYSYVRCKAVYTKEQVVAMGAEDKDDVTQMGNWLGTVVIWEQLSGNYIPVSTDIFMPQIEFEDYPEPDVGEVRFVGWTSFPTNSSQPYSQQMLGGTEMVYDLENDGYWVYPRGQTVNCNASEFMSACKVYAGDEHATSFTLPCLDNFIRLNPRVELQNPLKSVAYKNGMLLKHKHDISLDAFQQVSMKERVYADISIPIGKCGASSGMNLHGSYKDTIESKLDLTGSASFEHGLKAKDQSTARTEIDIETHPPYNQIPILLYIGRR